MTTNPLCDIRDGSLSGANVFLPAIYEHKAALIGRSPYETCYSARWLTDAVIAEFNTYAPVAVVTGLDVYCIEPEAFGCHIGCPEGSQEVPALTGHLPEILEDVSARRLPDPHKSGRMPLMLEAAAMVVAAIGAKTMVQAPISGPFTMAAELIGLENLIFAIYDCPAKARNLLQICLKVAQSYGQALLGTGAQLAVFDSRASCNVISPDLYREYVLPLHLELLGALRKAGANFISLIIGGNTVPVVDSLFSATPDLVVADFNVPPEAYLKLAETHPTIVRMNVNPLIFNTEANSVSGILAAKAMLRNRKRCLLGSGIIPYATPSRHLMAARNALKKTEA